MLTLTDARPRALSMRARRFIGGLLVSVAISSSWPGLAQAAPPGKIAPETATAPLEIRLWYAMRGAPAGTLERLAGEFNTVQNEFRVVPEYKGNYEETLAAGLAAHTPKPKSSSKAGPKADKNTKADKSEKSDDGDAPILLQVSQQGSADILGRRAVYKPLDRLTAETRVNIDAGRPFPTASVYADAKGNLLAFPLNTSTPVLYINRDKWRAAGLDPDKPPRTWYEMQPLLLKLQEAGEACPYTTSWQTWVHVENTNAWHNNPMASESNGLSGTRAALNLAGHLMARHISLMGAWVRSELFRFPSRHDESDTRFASGECVLLTSSSEARTAIKAAATFDVGMVQLPHYDDYNNAPYSTLTEGSALWVMAGGKPREYVGAARFLAYLASPSVVVEWQKRTGFVPVTQHAYTALQKGGYYTANPEMEIPAAQLRGFRAGAFSRGVRLGNMAAIRAILDDELDAVWSGNKAPMTALEDAVKRGNAVLRTFEKAHPGK